MQAEGCSCGAAVFGLVWFGFGFWFSKGRGLIRGGKVGDLG